MIDRAIAATCLAAPGVYVALVVLPRMPASEVGVPVAFGLCVAAAVVASGRTSTRRALGGAVFALLLGATAFLAVFPPTSLTVSPQLAVGALFGALFLLAALAWREGESLGVRFLALGASVTLGIFLLAAAVSLGGSPTSALGFLGALGNTFSEQVVGLAGLIGRTGYLSLPASTFQDPFFAGVVALAIVGLIVEGLRPQTGEGNALPTATGTSAAHPDALALDSSYEFNEPQRAVYEQRSLPQASPSPWPPGLLPIAGGAVAALTFLVLVAVAPTWALLSITALLAGVIGTLVLTADRPPRFPHRIHGRTPVPGAGPGLLSGETATETVGPGGEAGVSPSSDSAAP